MTLAPRPFRILLLTGLALPALLAAQTPPAPPITAHQAGEEARRGVKENWQKAKDAMKQAPAEIRGSGVTSGDDGGLTETMEDADRANEQSRQMEAYAEAMRTGDLATADAIMQAMINREAGGVSVPAGESPWIKKEGRAIMAYSGGKAQEARAPKSAAPKVKNASAGNRKIRTKEVDLSIEGNAECQFGADERQQQLVAGLEGGRKGFQAQYSKLKAIVDKNPNDTAAAERLRAISQAITNQDNAIAEARNPSSKERAANLDEAIRGAESKIAELEEALQRDPSSVEKRRELANYKACLTRDGEEYARVTSVDAAKPRLRAALADSRKKLEDAKNAFAKQRTRSAELDMIAAQKKFDEAKTDYELLLFENFPKEYQEHKALDREFKPGPSDMTGAMKGMQKDEPGKLPVRTAPYQFTDEQWAIEKRARQLEGIAKQAEKDAQAALLERQNAPANLPEPQKAALDEKVQEALKRQDRTRRAYEGYQERRPYQEAPLKQPKP